MDKDIREFDLEIHSLGFFIHRALYSMIKSLNKELKNQNINLQHSEFTILEALNVLNSASQSQLAAVLGKERSGIGRSLSSLEEKGFIRREALNGSSNIVTLTEKSRQIIPLLDDIIKKVTDKAFKGIPQKSRLSIVRNLTKIYNNGLSDE